MNRPISIHVSVAAIATFGLIALVANLAMAATVSYWRFEGNDGVSVADGTLVSGVEADTPLRSEVGGAGLSLWASGSAGATRPSWQGDQAGELFGAAVPNPDPIDTAANGTLNADGLNTRSLLFDNELKGHVVTRDNNALDFTGQFTIEGFFRTSPADLSDVSVAKFISKRESDGSGKGYELWITGGSNAEPGLLNFLVDDGPTAGRITFDDSRIDDDSWHHFAAIRDSVGDLSIWIDGVEDVTPGGNGTTQLSGDLSNSRGLFIGCGSLDVGDPERSYQGYLDEIRFSNTALQPSQFLIPEPGTVSLVLLGLTCCLATFRFRRSRA